MLKTILKWAWCPVLITALAVLGIIYQLPLEAVIPTLIIILGIGLVIAIIDAREKQLALSALRLRQLTSHFNRRFVGNSPLSIFTIIDTMFSTENPKLWEWARACDMSQRIFDTWCNSFVGRVESEVRTKKLAVYLWTYLNELWAINSHYYEFIDQFYDVAKSMELPRETTDQYNRFVMEYNAFVQNFRDGISELREVAKTGIDPPSVKLAQELAPVRQVNS